MSTILPAQSPDPEVTQADIRARRRLRVPKPRTRREGGSCGNCGFEDTGHYCSRCGEPLHGTQDSVMEILWSDLVEGPLHNLFALGKTSWLMLVHPHRFFHGVLLRQRGLTGFPFFLAPAWSRVSHKPHGVPNAVKYFVLIYTLAVLSAWGFGVSLVPDIPVPFRQGLVLPGTFAEPLFLLFVVFAAWLYAAAVSRLLGGQIETEVLTKFMLYLNGFALIPFVGMAIAGVQHLWTFLGCMVFWLYVLFVLPQVALPRLFEVPRLRLGMAQAGAAAANLLMVFVMVFTAGVVADSLGSLARPGTAVRLPPDFDMRTSGMKAVERAAQNTVFPVDTVGALIGFRIELPTRSAPPSPARRLRHGRPR